MSFRAIGIGFTQTTSIPALSTSISYFINNYTYKSFQHSRSEQQFLMRSTEFPHSNFSNHNLANASRLTSGSHLANLNKGLITRGPASRRDHSPRPNYNNYYDNQEEDAFNLQAILNTGEVFPEDLLLLLTEETKNIKNFKARIEKQKLKVLNDMELFKKEINHIIDDLKISMMAELDVSYKTYIEKYAYLKSQVQEIRLLKKQIEAQNTKPDVTRLNSNSSNSEMVKEIERQVANLRSYKISQYINDIQKKKLFPLMELSKEIIIMTSSPFEFYDAATTSSQLAELRGNFSHFTKHMFNALKTFVRTPEGLFQAGKQEFAENENYQKDIEYEEEVAIRPQNTSREITRPIGRPNPQAQQQLMPNVQKNKYPLLISNSLQNITLPTYYNNRKIVSLTTHEVIKPPHNDILLCTIVIQNKYIVSGGRDGILNVMTLKGAKVATLRGHQASICCLALIQDNDKTLLASGSDHGCSSIIIWDTKSWNIIFKMQNHSAAVTSIIDVGDGQTLISGSYDKKINVYNYKTGSLQYSLPNNKSSVFSLLLNSTKTKLIEGVLDTGMNGMYIWNIKYGLGGVVETLVMDKFIQNNNVLCSMSASAQRQELVVTGSKDGKIKLWNIETGTCEKILNVSKVPIIEIALIQRQRGNYPLIVSASVRDVTLTLTNSETGISSPLETDEDIYLEFGCGIGPKIIFAKQNNEPLIVVVNQSKQNSEVGVFSLGES